MSLLLLQAPVEKVKALIEYDCVEPVFGLYVVSTRSSVPYVSVPPCLYFGHSLTVSRLSLPVCTVPTYFLTLSLAATDGLDW